jgi:signal transduction histidine kinase
MTGHENIPPALREYVEDIRSVAMETQDHMRDIVWMLNPKNDTVDLLVSRMKDDAARLLRELEYSFVAPHELPAKIDLTLKRNIFLIYKEALHNIVKHARASHVEINVALRDGSLDVRIHDNGRGFEMANVSAGNGLDSIKERARQIRAELHIRSHPGEGTDIHLSTKIA